MTGCVGFWKPESVFKVFTQHPECLWRVLSICQIGAFLLLEATQTFFLYVREKQLW